MSATRIIVPNLDNLPLDVIGLIAAKLLVIDAARLKATKRSLYHQVNHSSREGFTYEIIFAYLQNSYEERMAMNLKNERSQRVLRFFNLDRFIPRTFTLPTPNPEAVTMWLAFDERDEKQKTLAMKK